MSIQIPGQPEGIEVVRFGIAAADEFELTDQGITQGPRQGTTSQIIVRPAKGWAFVFDPRQYAVIPAKSLDPPLEITETVRFSVKNTMEKAFVDGWLNHAKELPGYVVQDAPQEPPAEVTPEVKP